MWPLEKASKSQLYPLFDEIRALSSNYTVLSNVTQEYSTVTAAIVENVSPSADAFSFYGGSTELASRFVSQSMLEDPQSIRRVGEAIWKGLEIGTSPLKDRPVGVLDNQLGVVLFGSMPAATKARVNETGANPGFYDAAWHVVYIGWVFLSHGPFGFGWHAVYRSWTVGISHSTYASMVQAVKNAVGPLNSLEVTSSYKNEGSVWETNWQEGKGPPHAVHVRPHQLLISSPLKPFLVTSTTSCSRSNRNTIRPTVRLASLFLYPDPVR